MLDLCSMTLSFCEHWRHIEAMASVLWDEVESEYSADILLLHVQFVQLDAQLAQMDGAAKHLALTLMAVVVNTLRDFSHAHLSKMAASDKQLAALAKDYESVQLVNHRTTLSALSDEIWLVPFRA